MKQKSMAQLDRQVAAWQQAAPIGTEVEYHPVSAHRVTKTRSAAFVLSGHTACVFLEGVSGCVALDACVVREFGIWTLPATQGAVRRAAEYRFEPAHYDAVERWVKRAGHTEITSQDVENIRIARDSHEAAICGQCGLFHDPPACTRGTETGAKYAET